MSEQKYPVGSKVIVTKEHSVTWGNPWPVEGDVMTITGYHPYPHAYGGKVNIYLGEDKNGSLVYLQENCIEAYVEPLPVGTLVFVKETHSASEGRYVKVYAGDHLTIRRFSKGSGDLPDFYWCVNSKGDYRAVLTDKIAPVEFEEIDPPVAPSVVGKHDQVIYHEKGTELEGYWKYNSYWGWSNFVASNPHLYRKQPVGTGMGTVGVLAET